MNELIEAKSVWMVSNRDVCQRQNPKEMSKK